MPELKTAEWLVVIATLAGPVLAVQAQKWVERLRERRHRKLHLFYTLMATRAARVSFDHVRALNMIELEFYGWKLFSFRFQATDEKAIIDEWRIYNDHLNKPFDPKEGKAWVEAGDELFMELLYRMAKCLGYEFDHVQLKRGIYHPVAHSADEMTLNKIKEGLAAVLSGDKALPMAVTSFPISAQDAERNAKVQEALLAKLTDGKPVQVVIVEPQKASS